MNKKEIMLFIDGKITEKHRNRASYCREFNKTKQRINELITGVVFKEKDCKLGVVENILNDLGYELVIRKKDSEWKNIWELGER